MSVQALTRILLAGFYILRIAESVDLTPSSAYLWSEPGDSGCNVTQDVSVWKLSCELGGGLYGGLTYSIPYNKGALCLNYTLSCSSADGIPSCYIFSNSSEASRFSKAGQIPAELGLKYDGGCTGTSNSSCTAQGSYPDLEQTYPHLVYTKTSARTSPLVYINIGRILSLGSRPPMASASVIILK